jgi:hypothetical protein
MKTHLNILVLLHCQFSTPQEWLIKLDPELKLTVMEILDLVFHISNAPPSTLSPAEKDILLKNPRAGLRSISVGDTILVDADLDSNHRHIATVLPSGFKLH